METNESAGTTLDYSAVKSAAMIMRAMNHILRQKMLALINDKKRINVTDVYVKLRLEQSVASQHLAILRKAEVVSTERDGKTIYYSINYSQLAKVAAFVSNITVSE